MFVFINAFTRKNKKEKTKITSHLLYASSSSIRSDAAHVSPLAMCAHWSRSLFRSAIWSFLNRFGSLAAVEYVSVCVWTCMWASLIRRARILCVPLFPFLIHLPFSFLVIIFGWLNYPPHAIIQKQRKFLYRPSLIVKVVVAAAFVLVDGRCCGCCRYMKLSQKC